MRTRLIVTGLCALAIGAAIAMALRPIWLDNKALHAIASPDAGKRDAAWAWLLSGQPIRVESRLSRIHDALAAAPDDAVLDAGARLRPPHLWAWDRQPEALALRERGLLAVGDVSQQLLAAEEMRHCPAHADTDRVLGIVSSLLAAESSDVQRQGVQSLCIWLGRDRANMLSHFPLPTDALAARTMLLAQSWADSIGNLELAVGEDRVEVIEAALVAAITAAGEDARLVEAILPNFFSQHHEALPHAYLLGLSNDPRAHRLLERLARQGDDAARFVLQAKSPSLDAEQSRRILNDAGQPAWRKRLAAWRLDNITPDRVMVILSESPTERDGATYAAALLAEKRLPRDAAIAQAEQWLRGFDEDFKRAGGLLASLLGEHASLVRQAMDASPSPIVRTSLRLALVGLGEEPIEFAHRALHKADGDVHPDALLCLLLVGDPIAFKRLVTLPDAPRGEAAELDWSAAVQARALLIERFAPTWHHDAGRPVGGNARGLRLHFDRLHARLLLEQRTDGSR